jgi:hypothetical protein
MSNAAGISPFEIRILILRHWGRPLYHLAPLIGVHPATLSGMLTGRLAMPPAIKTRILDILEAQEARDAR